MDQTTLKNLRLVIPGIFIIGAFYKYYELLFSPFEKLGLIDYSYLFFFSAAIGAVYAIFKVRSIVVNSSHRKIDLNIKNSLIKLYPVNLSQDQYNYLVDGRRLKSIFYHFIDNDASLTVK